MKTVELKMMTDAQEKISDLLQPLLECAEQKRNIDEWNDHATKLLEELDSLLSKQEEKLLADFKKVLDSDLYTLTAVVELEKKEMVEKLDWEEQMENKILIDCFNPNEQTLNMPKLLNLISSTINQAVDEQLKDIIKLNNKVYDPIELEILLEKKLNLGSKP